jgi:hypothetical protein
MTPRLGLLLIAGLAACEHSTPFRAPDVGSTAPFGNGSPVRLTYNPGQDRDPSWLPDGVGFLYSRERIDRRDRDWCIGRLPPRGGSLTGELCDRQPAADDSIDAFTAPAPGRGGMLAYVRATAPLLLGGISPSRQELVVGSFGVSEHARALQGIPYQGPSGRGHEGVSQIRWLTPTSFVYLGQHVFYETPCRGCPTDTLRTGLELVRLDFATTVPTLTMLPGSDQASSVDVAGSDTVYFTLNGDSRVFRLVKDTIGVVHDFAGLGIARDVQVRGRRLIAVVGGNVSFANEALNGPVQRDGGGPLWLVSLDSGTESLLTGFTDTYRHPALEPSGRGIIVERLAGRTADLWRFDLP